MAMQRRMLGFRLHEVPHIGNMGKDEPKRCSAQLLLVPNFVHADSRVDLASRRQPLFVGDDTFYDSLPTKKYLV